MYVHMHEYMPVHVRLYVHVFTPVACRCVAVISYALMCVHSCLCACMLLHVVCVLLCALHVFARGCVHALARSVRASAACACFGMHVPPYSMPAFLMRMFMFACFQNILRTTHVFITLGEGHSSSEIRSHYSCRKTNSIFNLLK